MAQCLSIQVFPLTLQNYADENFNDYGYLYARVLVKTGLGFRANVAFFLVPVTSTVTDTVTPACVEYVLLSAVEHVVVALKRTRG